VDTGEKLKMSKKPKQSRHRVPTLSMTSDPVTAEYQAEVDLSMERLTKRYAKAQRALAAAEQRAERARKQAEDLERRQAEAAAVAENRAAEEARLSEYIERIKDAAKNARVAEARADLERKQKDAIARRNAETARRKADAALARDRREQIRLHRNAFNRFEGIAAEHRREVREIERLMMPGNYAGSSHRGTGQARHNSGGPR